MLPCLSPAFSFSAQLFISEGTETEDQPQANENLFVCRIHTKQRSIQLFFPTQANKNIRNTSEQVLSQVELGQDQPSIQKEYNIHMLTYFSLPPIFLESQCYPNQNLVIGSDLEQVNEICLQFTLLVYISQFYRRGSAHQVNMLGYLFFRKGLCRSLKIHVAAQNPLCQG